MKGFTDRNPKIIGAIALAMTCVVVVLVFVVNGSIFARTYSVEARFSQNAGLTKGAEVLVAGVKVGSVGAITLDGNAVNVQLKLNRGIPLPADSSAAISVETLLGLVGVEIDAGSSWSHLLHNGSVITRTSVPFEFYQVQNQAGQVFGSSDATALNQLITTLVQITQGKQQQVSQIISGLAGFTQTINQNQGQLGQLIDAANSLSGNLSGRDDQLTSALDNLDTVVSGLAENSQSVGNLIDGTEQAAQQTSQLVGSNQPQLQSLLTNLHTVLGVINNHQLDVAQGVAYLDSGLTGFASTGYSGADDSTNSWMNIYIDLAAQSNADAVLGSCGIVDQALDQVLGPDPLPCDQRTGPLPVASGMPSTSLNSAAVASPQFTQSGTTKPEIPNSDSTGVNSVISSILGTGL